MRYFLICLLSIVLFSSLVKSQEDAELASQKTLPEVPQNVP